MTKWSVLFDKYRIYVAPDRTKKKKRTKHRCGILDEQQHVPWNTPLHAAHLDNSATSCSCLLPNISRRNYSTGVDYTYTYAIDSFGLCEVCFR